MEYGELVEECIKEGQRKVSVYENALRKRVTVQYRLKIKI